MGDKRVKQAIKRLNALIQCDPEAVRVLVDHRVSVPKDSKVHRDSRLTTLRVLAGKGDKPDELGIVGLLNLVLRDDDKKDDLIAGVYHEDKLTGFLPLYPWTVGTVGTVPEEAK